MYLFEHENHVSVHLSNFPHGAGFANLHPQAWYQNCTYHTQPIHVTYANFS